MKPILKAAFGIVIAPLGVAMPFLAYSIAHALWNAYEGPFARVVIPAILIYLAFLVALIVLGVPILLVLWRLTILRWWTVLVGGLLAGFVLLLLLTSASPQALDWNARAVDLLFSGFLGGLTAICGWPFWRSIASA